MNYILDVLLIKSLLISFTGCNPLIKYSFCHRDHKDCKPKEFGANSTLIFRDLEHNVYVYNQNERPDLSISCTAPEPVRWIFSENLGIDIKAAVSNLTVNDKSKTYYYEARITEVHAGIVRCESYENPTRAAEIYIDTSDKNSKYPHLEPKIKPSIYYKFNDTNGATGFLVPCILRQDHFKAQKNLTLRKLTRHQMTSEPFTGDCVRCISTRDTNKTQQKTCNASRCGPLWIRQEMWDDAWSPHQSKTNRNLKDCLSNLDCSKKTFNLSKIKIPQLDCNGDGWITCSDRFSAIRSYPNECQNFSYTEANFNGIESCLFEGKDKTVNDATYDPRFGFLLPSIDNEAFYMCPSVNNTLSPVILSMNSLGSEINTTMTFNSADSTKTTKRLSCLAPDFSTEERLQLDMISCPTVFDCQTKLETTGHHSHFRRSANPKSVEFISKKYQWSHKFGKFIKDPVTQGAALCFGFFSNGFVMNLDLFFTGLDDQFYFLNGVKEPEAAIVQLTSDTPNLSVDKSITVNCTIATFILFPVFRFTLNFSNGTTQEITQDLQTASKDSEMSIYKNIIMKIPANLDSLECAAPYRNSLQWATYSLYFQNDNFMERTPEEPDGPNEKINGENSEIRIESMELGGLNNGRKPDMFDNENDRDGDTSTEYISPENDSLIRSPLALVFILTPALIVLLVIAVVVCVVCCHRYKVAKDLRDLTCEEVDNFLYGKSFESVIIFNNDKNFNAESVDFPSQFCIGPSDVETNARDVLWEGDHSRFVTGKYRGTKVAIKVTKSSMDVDSFKDILLQIKTTVHVQGHVNILNCLGAVVDDLKQRKCLAIFELSPYGDLISYLQYNALRESEFENYNVNVADTYTKIIWKSNTRQITLKKIHLYHFCEQIAAAMDFLGTKKVVHGKLAARNVLVFPSHVVKITDFGLSRNLYKASNYKKGSKTLLPWRWMAIESLKYMEFSPVTDMWSFGVTTWEIFSMGKIPYSDIVFSAGFADKLDGGLRLDKPEHATDEIYHFMCRTWSHVPSTRPSFIESRRFFKGLLMGSRPSIC